MATAYRKRKPPKLMACMTKASLETVRNKALFAMDYMDEKSVRRKHLPLYECVLIELRESGYTESADYFQDLIYDNVQLMAEDDIGILVDIRKNNKYVEEISTALKMAEKEKERGETKLECLHILKLAMTYAERGKGIIWLAEKFYLVAIAVSSKYLVDGGRQKAVCNYHYAKFLLEKFPKADPEEPYQIMTKVRDMANGRSWPLYEPDPNEEEDEEDYPRITVFVAAALQLHRLLLIKVRAVRATDPNQAERLSRLAERRAFDAQDELKQAEAIIEMGISQMALKNLNNAYKTFQAALNIYTRVGDIKGICEAKMHLAAVLQRQGDHQNAAAMLTDMGSLAMEHSLRKQLGRALHLLGELHLRRGRPELGTEHLAEAFSCFMGFTFQETVTIEVLDEGRAEEESEHQVGFRRAPYQDVVEEEAEQSRLMMAISAGQELMASFFEEIRDASICNIARHKIIEWKLSKSPWWVEHNHHKYLVCLCPMHNRSPIDVMRLRREATARVDADRVKTDDSRPSMLFRTDTVEDIRKLRSSFQKFQASHAALKDHDEEKVKKEQTIAVKNLDKGKDKGDPTAPVKDLEQEMVKKDQQAPVKDLVEGNSKKDQPSADKNTQA